MHRGKDDGVVLPFESTGILRSGWIDGNTSIPLCTTKKGLDASSYEIDFYIVNILPLGGAAG